MRKIIIVLFTSLCTFAEAQKPIEWQIKLGIYKELLQSFPSLREGFAWRSNAYNSHLRPTISLAFEIKKWKTLFQFNFDSKLVQRNRFFEWQEYRAISIFATTPAVITQVGDLIDVDYSVYNSINVLYLIHKSKFSLYTGVGLSFRKETIGYISYKDDPRVFWPVLTDFYEKIRFAPNAKLEIQYNVFKKFFLSSHINYAWFDETPHSYWQFALNSGIRF